MLYSTEVSVSFKQKVVSSVVSTNLIFRFSLPISLLMATAIPVRGAKFKKDRFYSTMPIS
ncbi:TPA: hypothetical protein ACN6Z6_004261 [Escherichia albertii]|nr:hypothetical protein [Escherichia albertii]